MKLNSGDKLLIDFDGIIVENINPTTKRPFYPQIGPIKEGIKEFLDECKKNNIVVEVWSARTNSNEPFEINPNHTIWGQKGVEQLIQFMNINKLFFYLYQYNS
jgi:hypothetical protein